MTDSMEILVARRRLTDAMHAMHVDQRIKVDMQLAKSLEAAWMTYDAAVRADERSKNGGEAA